MQCNVGGEEKGRYEICGFVSTVVLCDGGAVDGNGTGLFVAVIDNCFIISLFFISKKKGVILWVTKTKRNEAWLP
jgi:hypothetical protein